MSEFINNQTKRQEKLKEVIKKLHNGHEFSSLKEEFSELLNDASAREIAEMEQTLIAEGLPIQEIQHLCDIHVAMFREALDQQLPPEMTPGHPIYTMRAENEFVVLLINDIKASLTAFKASPPRDLRKKLIEKITQLRGYERHYSRKENLLFPVLESYGFTGPTNVMWAIHDDIRRGWKKLQSMLSSEQEITSALAAEVDDEFSKTENAIREMIYKEDRILFPNALEQLNDDDWGKLYEQETEIGFAFVTRGEEWQPQQKSDAYTTQDAIMPTLTKGEELAMVEVTLDTGKLSLEQVNLLLKNLPVDVTYVDENDTVLYYSAGKERIFTRTPAIIGRKVQNCHPPASVDRVQVILDDFRAGKRDTAEFWIQMGGKFIHIRYFAIRDEQGKFRGTVEVSQDVTQIRELEGEKRL